MATWQAPSGCRPRPLGHLPRAVGDAPMRGEPGLGIGMRRPQSEDGGRHWQEGVEIAGAGPAPTEQGGRLPGTLFDPLAELPRQDPAAVERIALGWEAARLKMSSSTRAASSRQGTTPAPLAASPNDATPTAGPLIVRW
jgi:hypothetical protein